MDGWKMSFLVGFPIFRGYVKLRGGVIWHHMWKISAEADLSSQVSIRRGETRNVSADGGGFSGFVVFFWGDLVSRMNSCFTCKTVEMDPVWYKMFFLKTIEKYGLILEQWKKGPSGV